MWRLKGRQPGKPGRLVTNLEPAARGATAKIISNRRQRQSCRSATIFVPVRAAAALPLPSFVAGTVDKGGVSRTRTSLSFPTLFPTLLSLPAACLGCSSTRVRQHIHTCNTCSTGSHRTGQGSGVPGSQQPRDFYRSTH